MWMFAFQISEANYTRRFVAGYEGSKIVVQATGSGGINELTANLAHDQAQYAYIRVDVEQDGSIRTKFVLISWVGESTSPLKKGKVSVDKPGFKAVVRVCIA